MAPAVSWTGIIGMLLGRLEFYVVIVGLVKLLSDARKMLIPRPVASDTSDSS